MNNNSRKMMLSIIGIALLVIGLVGVTFAFFNYTRTGNVNTIRTGRIYFSSNQDDEIFITNLFPMTSSEANNIDMDTVSIDIKGDTTYNDGEEYVVTFTNVNNTVNGKKVPLNYLATYIAKENRTIGIESTNYWIERNTKNSNKYLLNTSGEIKDNNQILVGYIDNEGNGIEGTLTIKAYIDADSIAITDTYDGTESDNMGTTTDWVKERTVFTTSEWNSFQNTESPISFKIKVEANDGIWVENLP